MARKPCKPVIGITVSRRKSKIACFFDWLAVWRADAKARFLTPGRAFDFDGLDGLIIGGGDDIGAELYDGEVALNVRLDPDRDALEQELLRYAIDREMPVLGICRGAQMMNVFLGGTLFGDIRGMPRKKTNIRTILARKIVTLKEGSKVRELLGRETIRVNSLHHQAVDLVGAGLVVTGCDHGNFVQALEHPDKKFFVGVQWHPEFLVFDKKQQSLFRALADNARDCASRLPNLP